MKPITPHKDPIVRIIERTDEITRKELESTTPQPIKGLSEKLETIINKAWSRDSNWAMKGFGYAMDTDCETEIELAKKLLSQAIIEARESERERIKNWVIKTAVTARITNPKHDVVNAKKLLKYI